MEKIETIIIGGGQAGLSTSYYLCQMGHEHLILEQASQPASAWRNDRWDSFALLTPNWAIKLPGKVYRGNNPDGFMTRAEVIALFEKYIDNFDLPVQYNSSVTEVTQLANGEGYQVKTNDKNYQAKNVVMATGQFQKGKIPAFSANIPANVLQLHSGQYRNVSQLPEGAVLIVGSAQSGTQIAEELYQSGRTIYLSICSAPRVPRRYRGKDIFEWLLHTGFMDSPIDKLPSPKAKFAGNPHLSGRDGGRTINLHLFARDGVKLLGRLTDADDGKIKLAADLRENLARADKAEADIAAMIDQYIARNAINAPEETLPNHQDGYQVEEVTELDLKAAGINTIIWAMGYNFDYSLVRLPVTDHDGYPLHERGVTQYPGLYFIGLSWLHKRKSPLLMGVGEDADYIATHITDKQSLQKV
jgi:putative flavoprotein involved in K+ transport